MSNDLVGRQGAAVPGRGTRSGGEHTGTPGKRTLVEQADIPAVQMHGGGAQPEAAVHATAARGVAAPASSLPFSDTLQRAFGRHNISSKGVAGESAEPLRSAMAGAGGTTGAGQQQAVQFLGKPLDQPLGSTDPVPAHGETAGKQRKYSPEQYIEMWEKEQGRKLTDEEKATIARGCIGITANNLNGGGKPLDSAEKIYGTFDQAHAAMVERNATLDRLAGWSILSRFIDKPRYIVFAKMFWSNQDSDPKKRKTPDPSAFRPDPRTGEVDMSGYKYREQPGFVNFDYAFWDEASHSFWHANHMDYGDPSDPMIVLQSTKEKFAQGYRDFDRVVYCIARAHNYDPGLAAITHAGKGPHG